MRLFFTRLSTLSDRFLRLGTIFASIEAIRTQGRLTYLYDWQRSVFLSLSDYISYYLLFPWVAPSYIGHIVVNWSD